MAGKSVILLLLLAISAAPLVTGQAAQLLTVPDDRSVLHGSNVLMTCVAISGGGDAPVISWSLNGEDIMSADDFSITTTTVVEGSVTFYHSNLLVCTFSGSEAGTYSCNAMNAGGFDLSTWTVSLSVIECTPDCVSGTCDLTVGECSCDDGFIGEDCRIPCSNGTFGAGCEQNCTCVAEQESSPCNHVNGTCHCIPGYTGESCEQECPEGFYGQDCLEECQCQNGASCDFITGFCNCTIGYMGRFCNMICPPLLFGLGCAETCVCETGNCHHITGECSCPVGFFGAICSHNCTEVLDCADIGREECSLDTPEQTCGPCLQGHVGEERNGNEDCVFCSGAPDCEALNRHPCRDVPNTCGLCFQRHLGEEGYSNQSCFDPCIDGVLNYNETDIDCGGSLCPSCDVGNVCSVHEDCSGNGVCLGVYVHPTKLDFPFNVRDNNTCVDDREPGNAILQRFKDALQGRENPLPNIDPLLDLNTLEERVEDEMQLQFNIREDLDIIEITDLDQAPGDPLYQTKIQLSEITTEERFDQMEENMHNGKLRGTLLLNRRGKKALFNF